MISFIQATALAVAILCVKVRLVVVMIVVVVVVVVAVVVARRFNSCWGWWRGCSSGGDRSQIWRSEYSINAHTPSSGMPYLKAYAKAIGITRPQLIQALASAPGALTEDDYEAMYLIILRTLLLHELILGHCYWNGKLLIPTSLLLPQIMEKKEIAELKAAFAVHAATINTTKK